MTQQKKEKTLELFGYLSLATGIFINIFLQLILKLLGICEHIPIILYAFGFSFLLLAMGILTIWLPKERLESLACRILMEKDFLLAHREDHELSSVLEGNGRSDEEFPILIDTFGYESPNGESYAYTRHLLITKNAPPNSVQMLSSFLDFKNIRPLKKERIHMLTVVGGEPLENVDSLIRTLGGVRRCLQSYHNTRILICTSTTDLEALKTIASLEGFINGFVYVPYNESSLRTLIEFTKFLNKNEIDLEENTIFVLPEMRNLVASVKGLDLGTTWKVDIIKDRRELEAWKGHHLRILNN